MPSPLQHLDVGTLVGSWPLALTPSFSSPALLPNTLNAQATILGIRRSASYAIGSKSFILDLDPSGGGAAVAHTVSFPAGSYTLAQIITLINTDVVNVTPPISEVVAYDDNGFLRLKSPRGGDNSYLGLRSVFGAEDIFNLLGLYSGTISKGGSLKQAQHVDPSRQIALPGQLGMQWGETVSVDVFNRAAMQLGWNTDLARALIDLKKVPSLQEETFTSTGVLGYHLNLATPGNDVFVGSVTTPSFEEMKNNIIVLDANGNELVKRNERLLAGPFADFSVVSVLEAGDPDLFPDFRAAIVESASLPPTFSGISNNMRENLYIILTNLTGGNANFNNMPLRLVGQISSTRYVVMNYNSLGQRIVFSPEINRSGRVVELLPLRAEIEGFYSDAGLTTRIENVQSTKSSPAVSGIEKNNRVRCNAATFITSLVKKGDLVTWTGASSVDPYSNNGTYRVQSVVDEKVIELVGSDYGPVYLNPNLGGGYGSITVKSDGEYWPTPYVKFAEPTNSNKDAGRGYIPVNGEVFKLVYQVAKPLRSATDGYKVTGSVAAGTSLRRLYKGDGDARRAINQILGPWATAFDVGIPNSTLPIHNFFQNTLQHLRFALETEHHPPYDGFGGINAVGRHSFLRPDKIDFYQDSNAEFGAIANNGPQLILRASSADDAALPATQTIKAKLRNFANTLDLWGLTNEGSTIIGGATQIGHGVGPFDPIIGSSKGIFDHFITRGTGRNALSGLRGGQAHLYLYADDAPGVTPGFLDGFSQSIRFRYTGPTPSFPVLQPTEWALGAVRATATVSNNLLKLDLTQNEGAAGLKNIQVWAHDGTVGINFQSVLGFSDDYKPQTSFHIRARSVLDEELLRLEGFNASHETVAMSFKPRRGSDLFSFIQVSKDGATNDWSLDFATTTAMDDAVTLAGPPGPTGQGFMRWVISAAFGVGQERMRLVHKSVEYRPDKTYITIVPAISNNAIVPAIKVAIANQDLSLSGLYPPFTGILESAGLAGHLLTGLRLYHGDAANLTTIKGWALMHNLSPTDPLGTTYARDLTSENGFMLQLQQPADGSITGAGGKAVGALYMRTSHSTVASPHGPGGLRSSLELTLPAGNDALPTRLTLSDGVIRLSPRVGTYDNGSNPQYGITSVIERNALYALSLIKHWIHIEITGGSTVATDRDGFNAEDAQVVGTKLRVTTRNNLGGGGTAIFAMPMTHNGGIVSFNCVVIAGDQYELEAVRHDGAIQDLSNGAFNGEFAAFVMHRD